MAGKGATRASPSGFSTTCPIRRGQVRSYLKVRVRPPDQCLRCLQSRSAPRRGPLLRSPAKAACVGSTDRSNRSSALRFGTARGRTVVCGLQSAGTPQWSKTNASLTQQPAAGLMLAHARLTDSVGTAPQPQTEQSHLHNCVPSRPPTRLTRVKPTKRGDVRLTESEHLALVE